MSAICPECRNLDCQCEEAEIEVTSSGDNYRMLRKGDWLILERATWRWSDGDDPTQYCEWRFASATYSPREDRIL